MAKSLRSKSRRRNVKAKREIYNAKAIEQLKKTLGLTKEAEKIRKEEIMKDLSEIAAAIKASDKNLSKNNDVEMKENESDSDDEAKDSSIKLKPGQHPVWKSQRKIKAIKKVQKKNKNKNKQKKNKQKKKSEPKTLEGKNKK